MAETKTLIKSVSNTTKTSKRAGAASCSRGVPSVVGEKGNWDARMQRVRYRARTHERMQRSV
jgi:hypothetical protein